ncbi:ABC transporter permease [Lederbergia lenta]|uniref:Acetoin transport system substrate binding protein YtrF n=1 Tax=Lederbergia lenta TaxID=1467 RepID=A0A2X4W783_LEDLE|nr:ABC transporter permease [Lederbergia lenta]MEC2325938.1 FtsX-like permease family protein [Lederbergia lenta]SQI53490.1 acetoin transport system substrate binding protein YtrF [Lederbergia lenta]
MTFKDQFRFVRQNMKKNKMRLFMTILATAIGCTFLIVLASVGFGLHKTIIQDRMEDQLVTEIDIHGKTDEDANYQSITDADIKHFESIDKVNTVTRRQFVQQTPMFTIEDYNTHAETFVAHFPSEIKSGFKLSEGRLPEKDNEILVGHHFRENLAKESAREKDLYDEDGFLKEEYAYKGDILGKTIDMQVQKVENGKEITEVFPVKIVGIAEAPSREWMKDYTVFISPTVMKKIEDFTGNIGGSPEPLDDEQPSNNVTEKTYDYVKVYADNVQSITEINEQLQEEQYFTYSIVSEMKQINMLFAIMKIGLIFIGTIALLIASIGIYNTMTMAVTERAPDIGIMKAIGANPKTIKNIFLLESSYIGLLGALIGTVVAYGISYIVNFALPLVLENVFNEQMPEGIMLSYIPLSLTAISIAICLIVTIFSGWRPAERATRIDVLKAMRREV